MCRLAMKTFASLDAPTRASGAPDEDRAGGFSVGGWSVSYWDDVMEQEMAQASDLYELLFGRSTQTILPLCSLQST